MREGTCAYSGDIIKKGSGTIVVRSDGRSMLYASKKVMNFVKRKIKARFIKWTQLSRTLLKKENTVKEAKIEIPLVVKIVRGFPSVPAHVLKERAERREMEKEKEKEKEREQQDKIKGKKDENDGRKGAKVSRSDMRKKN